MKITLFLRLTAVLVVLGAVAVEGQMFESFGLTAGGGSDGHTIVVIRADGSAAMTNETVQPRKMMEMQVMSWERYAKMQDQVTDGDDEGPVTPPQSTKPEPAKTYTNEELTAKIREMYHQRPGFGEEDAGVSLNALEVSSNAVRLVTARAFSSLRELLGQGYYSWGPTLLMYQEVRFEIDTNQHLRITFNVPPNAARYAKNAGRGWKNSSLKFEWKLVLPGKILSSGLPETRENATWITMDNEKPETIDAALKILGTPLVIIAEPAGLKIEEPMDSRKIMRTAYRPAKTEPDLPIVDAGPGFVAEALNVTLSSVHYFPEGEKLAKSRPELFAMGQERPGAMISAKLFPPKGRLIKAVSGLKVKSAKDDQGRRIPPPKEAEEGAEAYTQDGSYFANSFNPENEKSGAAQVQLQLGLPAPDAKTIEEIQAEAVAFTIGGWKEMLLTNVQADAKKEIDLGEVLPGAKLVIKKVAGRKPQTTIEATLEGPAAVNQIEIKVKLSSRQGNSSMSDRRSSTSGNKTTRNVTIQSYQFQAGGGGGKGNPTLLVRYPQEMKRERVQFKLTALDLF